MQGVAANQAARQGMGNLAQAEADLRARREAAINAPVELPRLGVEEQPFILGARAQPEPTLGEQAQRVLAEREYRKALTGEIAGEIVKRLRDEGVFEPQGPQVVDRRFVRPEDVPPYQRPPEPPTYPLREETPPLGREPGESTALYSPMRTGQGASSARFRDVRVGVGAEG